MHLYGLDWGPQTTAFTVEAKFIRAGGYLTIRGQRYGEGLFRHYRALQLLLWPEGEDHHRWSDLMLEQILTHRITAIIGARDCVAANTRILNPLTGEQPTIEELYEKKERPVVMTALGPMRGEVPFIKGMDDLYEIVLSNGHRFTTTNAHRVLTKRGYVSVASLQIGQSLLSYEAIHPLSTGELCPQAPFPNEGRSWKKSQGFQYDCPAYLGSCGGQPRTAVVPGAGAFPLQTCALEHNQDYCIEDDLACKGAHNRSYQAICRQSNAGCSGLETSMEAAPLLEREANSEFGSDFPPPSWRSPYIGFQLSPSPEWRDREFLSRISSLPYCALHETAVQEIRRKGFGFFFDVHVPVANHYFAEGGIHHNTGKTHVALSRFALTDYFVFPDETLILVSSTDLRGLQLRVWGDIKDLHRRAVERFPWLPGNVVESQHGIFTDKITEETPVRDMRRGIICIPCLDRKGSWVGGLEKFVGIKQKRRRVLGDEVSFMHREYLTILSNLDKGDFKGVFVGNPLANMKALDIISEPKEGWANHPEPTKTEVYDNRYGGVTVCLVGTDSPNFDVPESEPSPYAYLVDREDEKSVGDRYGRNSEQYFSQIKGVRKEGLFAHRILTREMCEQGGAFQKCIWQGESATRVYALDAGYGGDRAVAGWAEFGQEVGGRTVLRFEPPKVIPLQVGIEPEDQIAVFVKRECDAIGIPAGQMYFDAGMRATMATALSKMLGPEVNAVNFGGSPSRRPVSADEYTTDRQTGQRRLKRCDEHYIKFVTEMWFSVRLAVMSRQIRELPNDVAEEFYMREWTKEKGDRYEIETKDETKKRMGLSPDLADWAAIIMEGARRLGFMIENLPESEGAGRSDADWLEKELKEYRYGLKKRALHYV